MPETGGTPPTFNPQPGDPLCMSPNELPAMQLTNEPFNGNNFLHWSRGVRLALGAKVKLGFINGTCKKPPESETVKSELWMRCDYMIRCWLLHSMTARIAAGFMSMTSAKVLWDEVVERYGQANGLLLYQLKKELGNTTQNNLPMAEYYTKLRVLWDEIEDIEGIPDYTCGVLSTCSCNIIKRLVDAQARNKTIQFLMGVNDGYDTLRGNLLSMEPMLPVNKAFSMMLQAEQQKTASSLMTQEVGEFAVNRPSFGENQKFKPKEEYNYKKGKLDREERQKLFCNRCQRTGHTDDTCIICSVCGKGGHTIKTCYDIHGYPNNNTKMNKEGKSGMRVKYAANVSECKNPDTQMQDNPLEYTGANSHESSHHSSGSSGSHSESQGDNNLAQAVAQELARIWKVKQPMYENTSSTNMNMNFAGTCIASLVQTTDILNDNNLWIIDTGATDHMCTNLSAFIDMRTLNEPIFISLPDGRMKLVDQIGAVKDHITKEVVAYGRKIQGLYRLRAGNNLLEENASFSMFSNKCRRVSSSSNVEIRHSDLHQVKETVSSFLSYAENQFNSKIKHIRTDNGTEIVNHECSSIFREKGIMHQKSLPGNPQQNGRVERKHRHLLETARAMRLHANLPKRFWGECILAATHVINLLPSKVIGWKTPFEKLMGKQPDYSHLRIIGCECFASKPEPKRDKFNPKSHRCILLGYPYAQKGYKVYDLKEQMCFLSRDVTFNENIFPYMNENTQSSKNIHSIPLTNFEEDEGYVEEIEEYINDNGSNTRDITTTTQGLKHSEELVRPSRVMTRSTNVPSRFQDFELTSLPSRTAVQENDNTAINQESSVNNVHTIKEPSTYEEACQDSKWIKAMEDEVKALEGNHT
ncbi:uncharacterized protein LOC141638672 [Silene latifolia]|uniref:uncharacterized protein LOC141638672 n=1 Tax=Silene latifolia TaxID=37657 RepID=UPI003D7772E4